MVTATETGTYRVLAWAESSCPCAASASGDELPMTGFARPGLAHFDDAMRQFMTARSIPAGALVVSRRGVPSYQRGFGWLDAERTRPTPPHALFRLASVSKPIAAAAIRLLVAEDRLALDDRVFCLSQSPCLLDIPPFGTPDSRALDIDVGHLLDHRAGWDREVSGDPMFDPFGIADELGVPSPPGKRNIVRYMLGRPLDFDPGTKSAYSNFGYLVLGLVVEQVSGLPFTRFVQERVFSAISVAPSEIELARSLPEHRNPREPWYSDPGRTANVFDRRQIVPWPDGGFHVEAFEAHGGQIASAPALSRFLDACWLSGHPREPGQSQWWAFFGSMGDLHLRPAAPRRRGRRGAVQPVAGRLGVGLLRDTGSARGCRGCHTQLVAHDAPEGRKLLEGMRKPVVAAPSGAAGDAAPAAGAGTALLMDKA